MLGLPLLGGDLRRLLPLELPRLVARLPTPRDTPAILAAIDESRVELEEWMPWAPRTRDTDTLTRYVRRLPGALKSGRNLDFGVFERSSGAYLGGMGFARIDPDAGVGEIGYWIRRRARRRGVVTRIVVSLVELGFTRIGLGRIEIRCDHRNAASARIPIRLGFVHEGTLRGGLPDHTSLTARRDVAVYGLLEHEWRRLAPAWADELAAPFDATSGSLLDPA